MANLKASDALGPSKIVSTGGDDDDYNPYANVGGAPFRSSNDGSINANPAPVKHDNPITGSKYLESFLDLADDSLLTNSKHILNFSGKIFIILLGCIAWPVLEIVLQFKVFIVNGDPTSSASSAYEAATWGKEKNKRIFNL